MVWRRKKSLYLLFVGLIIIIIFLFCYSLTAGRDKTIEYKTVEINGRSLLVESVSDPWRQYSGLSNRTGLCADCGMLFVFPDAKIRGFVMRDMQFPLDIIFIAGNKIINIAENLPPEGSQPAIIYKSSRPADNVLEVPGGYCQKYGLNAGDTVSIK